MCVWLGWNCLELVGSVQSNVDFPCDWVSPMGKMETCVWLGWSYLELASQTYISHLTGVELAGIGLNCPAKRIFPIWLDRSNEKHAFGEAGASWNCPVKCILPIGWASQMGEMRLTRMELAGTAQSNVHLTWPVKWDKCVWLGWCWLELVGTA